MRTTIFNHFKKNRHVGPGGLNCSCCRPFSGTPKNVRSRLNRLQRRKAREELPTVAHEILGEADPNDALRRSVEFLKEKLERAEARLEAATEDQEWSWAYSDYEHYLMELGEAEYQAAEAGVL